MANRMPTHEEALRLFAYDADRGVLIWRERPVADFRAGKYSAHRIAAAWNKKNAGTLAGTLQPTGHRYIQVGGKKRIAHGLIWLYVHGEWPSGPIDHEFGVHAGDHVEKLRIASQSENMKNQKLHSVNTSGFNGVNWQKNRWRSRIKADGKCIHLGFFKDKADAIKARIEANVKYGFHENHGRIE